MHRSRFTYIAALLVAILVAAALPAIAAAQSAGEDQYTDPLAGGNTGSNAGGGSSGSGSGSGLGGGGSAPSQQAATPSSDDPAPTTQARPAQASSGNSLPRTGFPLALLAGSGLMLLGTGLALRRTA